MANPGDNDSEKNLDGWSEEEISDPDELEDNQLQLSDYVPSRTTPILESTRLDDADENVVETSVSSILYEYPAAKYEKDIEEVIADVNRLKAKREQLLVKKEKAVNELKRIEGKKVSEYMDSLRQFQQQYKVLKADWKKIPKEKLPKRLAHAEFYSKVQEAKELCRGYAYFRVFNYYLKIFAQIEANFESGFEHDAVKLFQRMKKITLIALRRTRCLHLKKYANEIVLYWETILRKKLIRDFEAGLNDFGWPSRLKTACPNLEARENFRKSVSNLAIIGDCDDKSRRNDNHQYRVLPVSLLMESVRRRFCFHFMSNKATSDNSKPELYFSQARIWLSETVPFIRDHLEPITVHEIKASSVLEFILCFSELLSQKITQDIDNDVGDVVFVKMVEESINYENEIVAYLEDIPDNLRSKTPRFVSKIFSDEDKLMRWLKIEKKACLEKLDDMLSSPTAWDKTSIPGTAEVIELFVAILQCLVDRFSRLNESSNCDQIIKLITELLEDFHVRCSQLWKSDSTVTSKNYSIDYAIADGMEYIEEMLRGWEELPFFVSLSMNQAEKAPVFDSLDHDVRNGVTTGCFHHTRKEYLCLAEEIMKTWIKSVMESFEEEMLAYFQYSWHEKHRKTETKRLLRQSIELLREYVDKVVLLMDEKVTRKWLRQLAIRIDDLLMKKLILVHRFSSINAQQLYENIVQDIFPIFDDNGIDACTFFIDLSSAISLLTLNQGEADLLLASLMENDSEENENLLGDFGLTLQQSDVLRILNNRTDLPLRLA